MSGRGKSMSEVSKPQSRPLAKHHRHTFTAFYYHLGPFGRQDVHVHACFDEDCSRVLIGDARECSGESHDHHRETL